MGKEKGKKRVLPFYMYIWHKAQALSTRTYTTFQYAFYAWMYCQDLRSESNSTPTPSRPPHLCHLTKISTLCNEYKITDNMNMMRIIAILVCLFRVRRATVIMKTNSEHLQTFDCPKVHKKTNKQKTTSKCLNIAKHQWILQNKKSQIYTHNIYICKHYPLGIIVWVCIRVLQKYNTCKDLHHFKFKMLIMKHSCPNSTQVLPLLDKYTLHLFWKNDKDVTILQFVLLQQMFHRILLGKDLFYYSYPLPILKTWPMPMRTLWLLWGYA